MGADHLEEVHWAYFRFHSRHHLLKWHDCVFAGCFLYFLFFPPSLLRSWMAVYLFQWCNSAIQQEVFRSSLFHTFPSLLWQGLRETQFNGHGDNFKLSSSGAWEQRGGERVFDIDGGLDESRWLRMLSQSAVRFRNASQIAFLFCSAAVIQQENLIPRCSPRSQWEP